MKLIDWQCHLTEHQSHTWLAVQQCVDEEVVHVIAKTSSPAREKQGWPSVDMSKMSIISLKQKDWWKQGRYLVNEYPDAIHVFGGFWADKRFFPLILYALWLGRKVVVMNEAYGTEAVGYLGDTVQWRSKLKVWFRPKLYQMAVRLIRWLSASRQFCVLALSNRAAKQFEVAGFLHEQVFPFGYFVPAQEGRLVQKKISGQTVRIIFVGALLKRKGLDLAVSAVESLSADGVKICLDIYGHGNPAEYILPSSTCVTYKGMIPFGQAQAVITEYDALILPSLHDGWGVVVNEALLQGVPVIVSSNVGAKCLIENSGAGMIFESGAVGSLQQVLKEFTSNLSLRLDMQKKAMGMARLITPKHAAKYMIDVMKHYFYQDGDRPKELWCKK